MEVSQEQDPGGSREFHVRSEGVEDWPQVRHPLASVIDMEVHFTELYQNPATLKFS
jgi:hypothetical protein